MSEKTHGETDRQTEMHRVERERVTERQRDRETAIDRDSVHVSICVYVYERALY